MKGISFLKSLLIYIPILLIFVTNIMFVMPFLQSLEVSQAASYFASMSFTLFILFVLSIVFFAKEQSDLSLENLKNRFRLNRLTIVDIKWTILGIIFVTLGTGLIYLIFFLINIIFKTSISYLDVPSFMGFDKIQPGQYEILILYIIYFMLNIFGEEFLWRGYFLPKHELKYGKNGWIINSSLWLVIHLCFGVFVIQMLPLIFILPFIVSKTKNTWVGIIIHGILQFSSIIVIINIVFI